MFWVGLLVGLNSICYSDLNRSNMNTSSFAGKKQLLIEF